MSGIYIQGMEMPNKKNGAVLIIYQDGKCAFEDGKTYQAVPVPPHGRLIDADALMEIIKSNAYMVRHGYNEIEHGMTVYGIQQAINDAPTIIPADKDGAK